MRDTKIWVWRAATTGLGLAAGKAAEAGMVAAWRRIGGVPAPSEPADRRRSLLQAVAFGLGVGALAGAFRVIAHRGAALGWEAVFEQRPPTVG